MKSQNSKPKSQINSNDHKIKFETKGSIDQLAIASFFIENYQILRKYCLEFRNWNLELVCFLTIAIWKF